MNKPIDIPTRETAEFIASYQSTGATILEVGCGAGHVALELLNRGYQVMGVDADKEMVAQAQARGVSAVHASWQAFDCPPVDAIAFTRSLHHISPLQKAIDKAQLLLKPTGKLLIEDFAFDEADETTINWFLEVLGSQKAKALITPNPDTFVTKLLASTDPIALWHHDHDHELHTIEAMKQAIATSFTIQETQSIPYLYRYLIPVLPETPEAMTFVTQVFQKEARLGTRQEIILIGRRIAGFSVP